MELLLLKIFRQSKRHFLVVPFPSMYRTIFVSHDGDELPGMSDVQSVLPQAKNTDIYLASLGVLLTAVYIYGLIFRPKRQFLDLGIDSQVVLVLYLVGLVGLFTIVGG